MYRLLTQEGWILGRKEVEGVIKIPLSDGHTFAYYFNSHEGFYCSKGKATHYKHPESPSYLIKHHTLGWIVGTIEELSECIANEYSNNRARLNNN